MAYSFLEMGNGQVEQQADAFYCRLTPNDGQAYHNAQLYNYANLPRRMYPCQAPLRLSLWAWASHPLEELRGTAGFGFWNHPFGCKFSLRLPKALWFFFASPPNHMPLAQGVAGHGWKAATFDANRPLFWGLLPFAPLGLLAMRVPPLYRWGWPLGQRALGVSEQALSVDLQEPHHYEILWEEKNLRFLIDGKLVHQTRTVPKGRLGFVAWLDNQYAVVTPQGNFGGGVMPIQEEQWLALRDIEISPL